jgi:hypothetical protein
LAGKEVFSPVDGWIIRVGAEMKMKKQMNDL